MSTKLTAIRLDDELLDRIEAYRKQTERTMQKSAPGFAFNHSDAIRTLLTHALDTQDRRAKRKR